MLGIGRSDPRTLGAVLLAGAAVVLVLAASADAQIGANRLFDEECLVEGFDTFDDVVMTGVATHDGGTGDVYQAICDVDPDGDCWAFSMNRGSQTTVLTVGLPSGQYDWFVCAWNGSVRDVVANLSGGAVLYAGPVTGAGTEASVVTLDDPETPAALRRLVDRLDRR